jgi:hypothetical protein
MVSQLSSPSTSCLLYCGPYGDFGSPANQRGNPTCPHTWTVHSNHLQARRCKQNSHRLVSRCSSSSPPHSAQPFRRRRPQQPRASARTDDSPARQTNGLRFDRRARSAVSQNVARTKGQIGRGCKCCTDNSHTLAFCKITPKIARFPRE